MHIPESGPAHSPQTGLVGHNPQTHPAQPVDPILDYQFTSETVDKLSKITVTPSMLTEYSTDIRKLFGLIFVLDLDSADETMFGCQMSAGRENVFQVLFDDCGSNYVLVDENELMDWVKESHVCV